MKGGAKIARDGCLKLHWLACNRMVERQPEGMQTHACAWVVLVPILAVTHHGMANVGHVDTDLVLAPGEQVQEEQ